MDDLPAVQSLIEALSRASPPLGVPVTAKIRKFADPSKTVAYAQMLEAAGCAAIAVHGRTREQKDAAAVRADWGAVAAVRAAVACPVWANGDVRDLNEAAACMAATGAVGVLSAEPLLHNPTLFDPRAHPSATAAASSRPPEFPALLALEYLSIVREHATPMRMVRGHVHKLLGAWLAELTHLRDALNGLSLPGGAAALSLDDVEGVCARARDEIRSICAVQRRDPVPKKGDRAVAREAEAARAAAVAEAAREEAALAALQGGAAAAAEQRKRPRDAEAEAEAETAPAVAFATAIAV